MVVKIIQYSSQGTDILKKVIGAGSGDYIYFWKSKGLSDQNITPPIVSDHSLTQILSYFGTKTRVEFNGSCLKQDNIVNIYIVYEINKNFPMTSCPGLEYCLFVAVILTKNADIDKHKYSGYGIGFGRKGMFSVGNGFGRNCIIFAVDMSFPVHADSKKKYILILGECPTQGFHGTTLTAEKNIQSSLLKIIRNSA